MGDNFDKRNMTNLKDDVKWLSEKKSVDIEELTSYSLKYDAGDILFWKMIHCDLSFNEWYVAESDW